MTFVQPGKAAQTLALSSSDQAGEQEEQSNRKRKKKERQEKDRQKKGKRSSNVWVCTSFKPLLGLGWVEGEGGAAELVVVERPWLKVSQNFPDAPSG